MTSLDALNPIPAHEKLLYTPVEAAQVLGIGRSTLYSLLGRGELRSVRLGGLRRIPADELRIFVETLERNRPGDRPTEHVEWDEHRELSTGSTFTKAPQG